MVTTASSAASGSAVTVPRAQVAALIQALSLPRNTLSAVFDFPDGGTAPPSWQEFGPQEQAALQLALPLLASPALVARTRAVLDEGRFLATWIVTGSGNDPTLTPYLLLAHDEAADTFKMVPVPTRETVARSLLLLLDVGLPAAAGDGFELPVGAFALLVALCDLYRRARFSAGLDHAPAPQQFTIQDIELALADGREHADPRWLLPHLLAIRPDLPAGAEPSRWLDELTRGGWLATAAGSVSLSEPGVRLAHALDRRLAMLTFWIVGATPGGELASRSLVLVRSTWQIWCFDVGGEDGDTAIGAPVDLANAYGLLQDLLTPVGVPLPIQMHRRVLEPAPAQKKRRSPPQAAPQPVPSGASGGESIAWQPATEQPPSWQLVVRAGTQASQAFPLSGQVTLGRSAENAICVNDEQASRRHARIRPHGGGWLLEDLGSRNGTFVNRERIGQAVTLQAGDLVQIGDTVFQVSGPDRVEPSAAGPACPRCGRPVTGGVRFCRHCGHSLP